MAVERLKTCDNIVALSKELGVHRRLLYKWRDQFRRLTRMPSLRRGAHRRPRSAGNCTSSSACWWTRPWRWIFSKVPCKKSRLDASRADALA